MKIGIFSDVHCDVIALEMMLEHMGPVDLLLCAGDMVLQYRFSNEIFDMMRDNRVFAVRGNHEAAIASAAGTQLRASGQFSPENLYMLENLPSVRELHIEGKRLVMMHTSPLDPTGGGRGLRGQMGPERVEAHRLENGEFVEILPTYLEHEANAKQEGIDGGGASTSVEGYGAVKEYGTPPESFFDVLVVGHTHQPVIQQVGSVYVINPGSVGQPRNPAHPNRRTYAVLDTNTWEATLGGFEHHVGSPLNRAALAAAEAKAAEAKATAEARAAAANAATS